MATRRTFFTVGYERTTLAGLSAALFARDVPSHWTPYVAVGNIEDAAERTLCLGGAVIVPPFEVAGVARIALIADAVGATIGLWSHLKNQDGESEG